VRKVLFAGALFAALWPSMAQACRLPIYVDAKLYGMIISPPPRCKECGRRFIVMDPQLNKPIRVIQLSMVALICYSPYGAVGEIGTMNIKGAPTDRELMQHSFLVGQKPPVSEQWYPKRKS
jgi:hypothetical protein